MAGLEVEFHVFKIDDARLNPADATWPASRPRSACIPRATSI